jgi:hypothetical protein
MGVDHLAREGEDGPEPPVGQHCCALSVEL